MSAKKTSASKPAAKPKPKPAAKTGRAGTASRAAPRAPAAERGQLIERSVAAKRARLAEQGHADIALIKRRSARIAEDFYDIGEALARLKRPGVAEALGYASFAELCQQKLGMSLTKASYLVAVVTNVPRSEAALLGQDRTVALLELADATPELDTVAQLAKGVVKLPGGKELRIPDASAAQIRAAAKAFRAAHQKGHDAAEGKRGRGRTTTQEERARADALQARLRKLGLDRAQVTALASKPGQSADVRIERLPLDKLAVLKKAL